MERRYVGIDLHRRRSVVVTMDQAGKVLASVRIPNDPVAMSIAVAEAGEGAEVAFEATYGWYWLADLLQADGHHLHLAPPPGHAGDDEQPAGEDRLEGRHLARRCAAHGISA